MGFWDKAKEQFMQDAGMTKTLKLEYLGGCSKIKGKEVKFTQTKEQKTVKIGGELFTVDNMEWDEKGKRSAGKAAAGAIAGGVLTGGIGAVAGAAIGGRKKENSLAVLSLTDSNGESYTAYFRCGQKEYAQLTALL